MKKVIVVIGIGFLSVAAILAGTNPQLDNQLVEETGNMEAFKGTKKKTTSSTNVVLHQPDAFLDYGINLNASTQNNLEQPDAFEDYNIDLYHSPSSSVSSTPLLIQPDAFNDYGIDLNSKKPSAFTHIETKEFLKWSSKIANFEIHIFGSSTTPHEVYAKSKEAINYTTYIMETMGQLVFTGQGEPQNSTETESSPQFLKLFFNFV